MYGAIYNSQNLGSGNYQITKIDISLPKNNLSKYELVQNDGSIVTSRFFGERVISITGRILANTLDEMQSRLDTLKSWTVGYEKPLDITIGTTNRRYTATVMNFNFKTQGYFCEWTINFSCDSLGYNPTVTSLTFGTMTASPTSYSNTFDGTYYAEPSFDFTVTRALPYWSAKYIEIKNPVKNERIRITRAWLPSDRVIINGRTKSVSIYAGTPSVISTLDSITGWASGHTLTLDTTNEIEGTGCAKVVMAAASTGTYIERLNATAIDLSASMGTVLIPIFIPTPTSGSVTGCQLILGSDATLASNYWLKNATTQWDGSAIATNAWNYFSWDLSTGGTNTGTPVRTAIKSIRINLYSGSNFQLNGWLTDYISRYTVASTPTGLDYEGIIPTADTGSTSLTFTDELTSRSITISGDYYKRWL